MNCKFISAMNPKTRQTMHFLLFSYTSSFWSQLLLVYIIENRQMFLFSKFVQHQRFLSAIHFRNLWKRERPREKSPWFLGPQPSRAPDKIALSQAVAYYRTKKYHLHFTRYGRVKDISLCFDLRLCYYTSNYDELPKF